jgi:hypothetical protein
MWLLEILKNPIVIGIIGFILAYLYLYYQNTNKIDPETNNPQKVSLAKPLIVGLLLWFVANNVFTPEKQKNTTDTESFVETSEMETESMKDVLSCISDEAIEIVKEPKKGNAIAKTAKVFTDVANF